MHGKILLGPLLSLQKKEQFSRVKEILQFQKVLRILIENNSSRAKFLQLHITDLNAI